MADMFQSINYNSITVNNENTGNTSHVRALEICWLAVILLIPLFLNPSSHQAFYLNKALLLQFIVIIMLAISIAGFISEKRYTGISKWKNTITSPMPLTVLVFGFIALVATIVSITPSISFWGSYFRESGFFHLFCWILFFIIVAYNLRCRSQLFRVLYALLLSSAIVSIIGILSSFFPGILLGYGSSRVSATIGNPLSLSNFLAMIIPINMALIIWLCNKKSRRRDLNIIIGLVSLLIIQFWCLWLAQYSITILLYIIGTLIFVALYGIVKRNKLIMSFGIGLILVVGAIALTIIVPLLLNDNNSRPDDYKSVENLFSIENLGLDNVGRRVTHWTNTIDLVLKAREIPYSDDKLAPFRTYIGYGPETFIITYQHYYPDDFNDYHTFLSPPLSRPHNHYLYLAATIGLLGLAGFIAIIIVFILSAICSTFKCRSFICRLLLIASIAGIIQYSADSLFNPSTIASELVFWVNLGLIFTLGRWNYGDENSDNNVIVESYSSDSKNNIDKFARTRSFISAGCAVLIMIIGINIVIRPFIADIYFQRGLQFQTIRDRGAFTEYEKAIELQPKEAVYWSKLGGFNYSMALWNALGNSQEAFLQSSTDAYEQALALERYLSFRYYPLADVYTYWAKEGSYEKWSRAMLLYEMASKLAPRNIIILNKWAHALVVNGDLEQAQEKIDYAKSMNKYWIGNALISSLILAEYGQTEDAVEEIIMSIEKFPDGLRYCETIYYEMAILNTLDTLHKALDSYTQRYPDEWIHHAMLGFTSLFVNNPDRSIDEFDTAMHLVPDKYAGTLFISIVKFSVNVPYIRFRLPELAPEWRSKLLRTAEADKMITALDKLLE